VRRALVVAETALALILVAGAALVTRSFARVMSVDPGFRADGVLSLTISRPTPSGVMTADDVARVHAWYNQAESRLAALPGVKSHGSITSIPYGGRYGNRILDVEGHVVVAGAERPSAQFRVVTPGYHETMGIPLVEGRHLGRQDIGGGLAAVVVSERFVRETWPDGKALGRRIRTYSPQGPWLTVVGVVGDIHERSLEVPERATVYAGATPGLGAYATRSFVLRSDAPMAELAGTVRAELQRFDPDQPIHDLQPMSARLAESVEQRRFVLVLFELFATLALALSALGLYGVLAHAVGERQREIGVRVALGATASSVLALVAREGAVLIGAGVALGVAGGLAVARVLQSLLYDVSPTDPLSLLAAVGLLLVASALALWLPARKALRVQPTEALRDE
jgi:predicted permease